MSGIFEDEALESAQPRRDTELTLGSGMLLGLFFGLVLVCGLCFGLGYALGARGSKGPVFQSQPPAAGPAPLMQTDPSQAKPSAMAQPPTPSVPQATASPQTTASVGQPAVAPAAAAGTPAPPQQPDDGGWHAVPPGSQPGSPVQAALPATVNGTAAVQPVGAVQPAMPSAANLMVQIAAVSDTEDATVLVGALRKRGYNVSANRNPADNLIHVCIGPFSDRNDANAMRQRLLNDGYNAIVLP